MFKTQKGITLVALVITIIVLLILAGVTMMLALGENGILGQASNARVRQYEADVKEQMQLAILSAKTEMLAEISKNPAKKFVQTDISGYVMNALPSSKQADYEIKVGENAPANTQLAENTPVTFTITYKGQDYKTATDVSTATISRTFTVTTYNLEDNASSTSSSVNGAI